MTDWATLRQRLPHVLLVLGLLIVAPPTIGNAQRGAEPVEVYQSPVFGYLFWWDADDWTVIDQQTEPGFDVLQLADDDTQLIIQGFAAPGLTAETCLSGRLDDLAATPDLTRFDSLRSPGAPPEVSTDFEGVNAESEFVLSDGMTTFVARERCSTIVPNELVLFSSTWIPVNAYNSNVDLARSDGFDTDRVFSTLTLPRRYWSFAPDQTWPEGPS